jgi:uncharacterized protein (TIGR03435 family)
MKRMPLVLILAGCTAILNAQNPQFDVASLKLLPQGTRFTPPSGGPGTPDPAHFLWPATTLTSLLAQAYGISGDQISGPDWMGSQFYSITANFPAETTREQFQLMLQNLLTERMHLAVHHETTTIQAYDLVIAKGGPKLKEPAPADPSRPGYMGGGQFGPDGATLTYPNSPLRVFLMNLSMRLRSDASAGVTQSIVRVNDKTGLTGTYNITLHYIPARMTDVPGPDIFAALETQLGLKLEPVKMQIDMVVVDHAEKTPLEN